MSKDTLRNVQKRIESVSNRYAEKVIVGQYTGEPEPERKEGDVWEDKNGKQWTMKNGIKQSISKLQDAKTPWWCPVCGKTLNHQLDMKFWRLRGKCHDCVAKDEHRIRIDGKWQDYEDMMEMRNQMAWLKDRIVELTYYHETISNPEFYTFDEFTGAILMVDKYSIPLDKVREDLRNEVVNMNKVLTNIENEYKERFGGLVGEEKDEYKELLK